MKKNKSFIGKVAIAAATVAAGLTGANFTEHATESKAIVVNEQNNDKSNKQSQTGFKTQIMITTPKADPARLPLFKRSYIGWKRGPMSRYKQTIQHKKYATKK